MLWYFYIFLIRERRKKEEVLFSVDFLNKYSGQAGLTEKELWGRVTIEFWQMKKEKTIHP